VERVRAGETLSTVESSTLNSPLPPTASMKVVEEVATSKSMKVPPKKAPPASNINSNTKVNGITTGKQQQSQKSYASVVPKKSDVKGKVKLQKQSQQTSKSDQKSINRVKEKLQQQQQEELPLLGKAKVVCGCFGTMHKALNNCLHCGRISCEREGYDYCPFCSYMVYEHRSNATTYSNSDTATNNHNNNEAWEQKERLLQYDREFAQRTIILDDQADYYNRTTSNWLNEHEQQEAQQQEQQRTDALQKRPRPKMILDLE
jgi:activating signal cointegrator 1